MAIGLVRMSMRSTHAIRTRLYSRPVFHPHVHELDYEGLCHCLDESSGNFYDFIPGERSRLMVALGDLTAAVEGPSITVLCMQALVRGLSSSHPEAGEVVTELNRTFHLLACSDVCTLFYASLDPVRRELRYVNAGAEVPLLIRRQGRVVHRLDHTGPVLGLSGRAVHREARVTIEPGDLLVAFSEGVVEARNLRDRQFSESGVVESILRNPHLRATELTQRLIQDVEAFSEGAGREKDLTVVVVRFAGTAEQVLYHEAVAEAAVA